MHNSLITSVGITMFEQTCKVEAEVAYAYWPASKGALTAYGQQSETDTEEEVEIVSIKINGTDVLDFFDIQQIKALESGLLDELKT